MMMKLSAHCTDRGNVHVTGGPVLVKAVAGLQHGWSCYTVSAVLLPWPGFEGRRAPGEFPACLCPLWLLQFCDNGSRSALSRASFRGIVFTFLLYLF